MEKKCVMTQGCTGTNVCSVTLCQLSKYLRQDQLDVITRLRRTWKLQTGVPPRLSPEDDPVSNPQIRLGQEVDVYAGGKINYNGVVSLVIGHWLIKPAVISQLSWSFAVN